MAIDHMLEACSQTECLTDSEAAMSAAEVELDPHQESAPEYLMSSPKVTAVARREVAVAIRDLMQHGLVQVS